MKDDIESGHRLKFSFNSEIFLLRCAPEVLVSQSECMHKLNLAVRMLAVKDYSYRCPWEQLSSAICN